MVGHHLDLVKASLLLLVNPIMLGIVVSLLLVHGGDLSGESILVKGEVPHHVAHVANGGPHELHVLLGSVGTLDGRGRWFTLI